MPILGAHMSIAGGYFKAIDAAMKAGCDCVQLFTKNNNQWRAKPITDEDAQLFSTRMRESKLSHCLSHSSYLLNLASADAALWQKSFEGLIEELRRAEQLGIPFVVVHPGACVGCTEESGISAVVKAVRDALRATSDCRCGVLLETTAGQGTSLGHKFEQLAAILAGIGTTKRVDVCVDTCHLFAAGYPLADRRDYLATFRKFDDLIGLERIQAFHLNDSKKELGSRVDRHEHIGRGKLGVEAFRHLLNDRRFRHIPMYLETEKAEENGEDLDVINLRMLRSLIAKKSRSG
jgi:deoxyribonuclease IV